MSKDSLGDRMKKYEDTFRQNLPERLPVIIRLDGKAFHTYTKGCKRPYDEALVGVMNETAQYLCKNVMNVKMAYVQSDEISLLLNNFTEIDTQSWYDNNIQKMVSISAAFASVKFSLNSYKIWGGVEYETEPAFFDSRAFVLPKEDLNNYFLWRQQDATRNSVQMLARSLYSHKELNNKNITQLNEMILAKGHNWNNIPTSQKRGRCIIKVESLKPSSAPPQFNTGDTLRRSWEVDNEIPVFSQNPNYINKYIYPNLDEQIVTPGKVYQVKYGVPGLNTFGD